MQACRLGAARCVRTSFDRRGRLVLRCASSVTAGYKVPAVDTSKPTIAVAMSGGIDSSVAAMLLQEAGYPVVGVFMRNWDRKEELESSAPSGVAASSSADSQKPDASTAECPIDRDAEDMQAVCQALGIRAVEVEFIREYWTDVFEPFLDTYRAGNLTPNPDAMCNKYIKFNAFRSFIRRRLGIEHMATGHYARMAQYTLPQLQAHHAPQPLLCRAVDPSKDQSYFLALTPRACLSNGVLFPLGAMQKRDVKAIAATHPALRTVPRVLAKKESMGLCFVGKRGKKQPQQQQQQPHIEGVKLGDIGTADSGSHRDRPRTRPTATSTTANAPAFAGFLSQYINMTPGRFIDVDTGRVVGHHSGAEAYTEGQGAGISGMKQPYFVVGIVPTGASAGPGVRENSPSAGVSVKSCDEQARENLRRFLDSSSHGRGGGADSMRDSEQPGDVYVASGRDHEALYTSFAVVDAESFNWIVQGVEGEECVNPLEAGARRLLLDILNAGRTKEEAGMAPTSTCATDVFGRLVQLSGQKLDLPVAYTTKGQVPSSCATHAPAARDAPPHPAVVEQEVARIAAGYLAAGNNAGTVAEVDLGPLFAELAVVGSSGGLSSVAADGTGHPWVDVAVRISGMQCLHRYRQKLADCTIVQTIRCEFVTATDREENFAGGLGTGGGKWVVTKNRQTGCENVLEVQFDAPQRAIAAGQVLAVYAGSVCLGGGIIGPAYSAGERK